MKQTQKSQEVAQHPLLISTRETIAKKSIDDRFYINNYAKVELAEAECLAISVSPGALERAVLLFQVLIAACAKRNIEIKNTPRDHNSRWRQSTAAIVNGETVEFHLNEVLVKKTRTGLWDRSYSPTGKLRWSIDSWAKGSYTKIWVDNSMGVLETRIDSFVDGLAKFSEGVRVQRLEHEAWMRHLNELRRLEKLEEEKKAREQARADDFSRRIDNWHRYTKSLEYLLLTEELLKSKRNQKDAKKLKTWLEWAHKHVASLDPIKQLLEQPDAIPSLEE